MRWGYEISAAGMRAALEAVAGDIAAAAKREECAVNPPDEWVRQQNRRWVDAIDALLTLKEPTLRAGLETLTREWRRSIGEATS